MQKKSLSPILIIALILVIVAIFNALLLFFENQDPASNIKSYSNTFWFFIVTIATVGYGDLSPVTVGGKIIGGFYVVASYGMLGFWISTITKYVYTMIEEKKLGFGGTQFEDHIIIIGWDNFSHMVATEMHKSSKKIAIVTNNKDNVDLIYDEFGKKNTFVLFSDYNNLEGLDKVNPNQSAKVYINFANDTDALIYIINFKKKFPSPSIIVSISNNTLKDTFLLAGAKFVIAKNEIASKLVASYIFEPDVAELNYDILSTADKEDECDNQEYKVTETNPFVGKDYQDVFIDLKKQYNCVLLGISKFKGNQTWELKKNPGQNLKVETNDYLILMMNHKERKQIEADFGVPEGR